MFSRRRERYADQLGDQFPVYPPVCDKEPEAIIFGLTMLGGIILIIGAWILGKL